MNECLFCKIIEGSIPSYTIYEDNQVKVFLDIHPKSNGHILIIPKKHIMDATSMDNETFGYMNEIIQKMYERLNEKLHCDGLHVLQNNGICQEVKHYHIHLIPEYKNKQKNNSVEEIFELLK